MSLTNTLYKLARLSADGRAVKRSIETGSPKPILRRVKNRVVGRVMARAGIWNALFRWPR